MPTVSHPRGVYNPTEGHAVTLDCRGGHAEDEWTTADPHVGYSEWQHELAVQSVDAAIAAEAAGAARFVRRELGNEALAIRAARERADYIGFGTSVADSRLTYSVTVFWPSGAGVTGLGASYAAAARAAVDEAREQRAA